MCYVSDYVEERVLEDIKGHPTAQIQNVQIIYKFIVACRCTKKIILNKGIVLNGNVVTQ